MSTKSMMRDETRVMGGWDINSVDSCTWTMVGCSPDGLVVSLEMANNGLSLMLSDSVGSLSHLQIISCSRLFIHFGYTSIQRSCCRFWCFYRQNRRSRYE